MMSLVYGLVTGILFGILLQRAEVLRYDRQVGALRLKDMTIFKFMLSAIVVASIGIYLLRDLGIVTLNLKATTLGAQIMGGTVFGIGWGLLGYCPGTAGGALGEGRLDAAWGLLGMVAGGMLYGAAYPLMKASVLRLGQLGKITLPEVTGLPHWIVILLFAALCLAMFRLFERKGV
jgi:uncharacterized membrane protein YedE/YeeE